MRVISAIAAIAIVIGIVGIVTARRGSHDKQTIEVAVSVVACVDSACFMLPVPEVAINVTGGTDTQLAHGVTDDSGRLTLPISYDGTLTVTGTSAILKGGSFSQDQEISGGESVSLDIGVPISAEAEPGV